MFLVLNAALYQAGWVACTLGAANGEPWLGVIVAMAIVAWHLARARGPAEEGLLILTAMVTGLVLETALLQAGWIRYSPEPAPGGLAPLWIVALWGLFATTFNVSLRALREHLALAAVLGAVGAPAAYFAGARLGALELVSPLPALAAIALAWAVATPALLRLARRFDGYAT
jgi:hypothetical protein